MNEINLSQPGASLFDEVAEHWAQKLANPGKDKLNKPTQLRRFYDELEAWNSRLSLQPQEFEAALPLIRMLNAKVAYAKGRDLINDEYAQLMRHCLRQVDSLATLQNMKLFMESVMGFLKLYRPKD